MCFWFLVVFGLVLFVWLVLFLQKTLFGFVCFYVPFSELWLVFPLELLLFRFVWLGLFSSCWVLVAFTTCFWFSSLELSSGLCFQFLSCFACDVAFDGSVSMSCFVALWLQMGVLSTKSGTKTQTMSCEFRSPFGKRG